jgi:hypothetical protein
VPNEHWIEACRIRSIFAYTFAHTSGSVAGGVNWVTQIFIDAFVTQGLASRRYACALAAFACGADAALYFFQAIDAVHCLSASSGQICELARTAMGFIPPPSPKMVLQNARKVTLSGVRRHTALLEKCRKGTIDS